MGKLNWMRGWNRIAIVAVIVWLAYILLYFPYKTGSDLRALATASYGLDFQKSSPDVFDKVAFENDFKEATFQVQFPKWIEYLWTHRGESFLVFVVVPVFFYAAPILLFLLIRWLVLGFRPKPSFPSPQSTSP